MPQPGVWLMRRTQARPRAKRGWDSPRRDRGFTHGAECRLRGTAHSENYSYCTSKPRNRFRSVKKADIRIHVARRITCTSTAAYGRQASKMARCSAADLRIEPDAKAPQRFVATHTPLRETDFRSDCPARNKCCQRVRQPLQRWRCALARVVALMRAPLRDTLRAMGLPPYVSPSGSLKNTGTW